MAGIWYVQAFYTHDLLPGLLAFSLSFLKNETESTSKDTYITVAPKDYFGLKGNPPSYITSGETIMHSL